MSDATISRIFSSDNAPRRTNHGSHAWSLPSQRESMRQPQDGAALNPAEVEILSSESRVSSVDTSMLREPEDAHLSGAMRSLARRVLGLNVTASRRIYPAIKQAELALPKLLKRAPRKIADTSRVVDAPLNNHPQVVLLICLSEQGLPFSGS